METKMAVCFLLKACIYFHKGVIHLQLYCARFIAQSLQQQDHERPRKRAIILGKTPVLRI